MPNSETSAPARSVINGNLDLANMATLDQIAKLVDTTLQQFIDTIIPHCGPYSQYALIIHSNVSLGFDPNIFLKDGVKILNEIDYVSPIQTYLKNMITYIATRVDSAANDGTTTAILLSSLFLQAGIRNRAELLKDILTTSERETIYHLLLQVICDYIQSSCWTLDKLLAEYPQLENKQTVAGLIAYIQALSSSGGRLDLAQCMKEIFTNTPAQGWAIQYWKEETLETSTLFRVEYSEYDFALDCIIQTSEVLNSALNHEYIADQARILVVPEHVAAQTPEMTAILDYIKYYPDTDVVSPLCIVVKSADANLIQTIHHLNGKRKVPIALFYRIDNRSNQLVASVDLHMQAVNAIASKLTYTGKEISHPLVVVHTRDITDTEGRVTTEIDYTEDVSDPYMIKAEQIYYDGRALKFKGIADTGDDNSAISLHPNYLDPKRFPPYTQLLDRVQALIKRHATGHKQSLELKAKCDEVCRQMVCPRAPILVIGGNTHDNISNRSVVQDVLGATMCAIENGFVLNGTCSIADMLIEIKRDLASGALADKYSPLVNSPFFKTMLDSLEEALSSIIKLLYGKDYFIQSDLDYMDNPESIRRDSYCNILAGTSSCKTFGDFLTDIPDHDPSESVVDYPVIQPIIIYTEIFKRVGELLVRLISTDKLIIPGGVYLDEDSRCD